MITSLEIKILLDAINDYKINGVADMESLKTLHVVMNRLIMLQSMEIKKLGSMIDSLTDKHAA